jgi:hypothetical protein
MPIRFPCSSCGATLGIARPKPGTVARCPKCSRFTEVPAPAPLHDAPARPRATTPPQAPARQPQPDPEPALAADHWSYERPPASAAPAPPAFDYPPVRKPRTGLKVTAVVGCLVLLTVGGFVAVRLVKSSGGLGPSAIADSLSGDRSAVREYISRNANDTDGLEFVEWGQPRQALRHDGGGKDDWLAGGKREAYQPATILPLKWRGKTPLGGKLLHEDLFLIQGGKVERSSRDRGEGFGDFERIGALREVGKLTFKIVRGTITRGGRPVSIDGNRESIRIEFEAVDDSFTRYAADVNQPRFELPAVRPGTYRVCIEWDVSEGGAFGPRQPKLGTNYGSGVSPLRCKVNEQSEIQVYNLAFN